jgi:hypothetical protein
MRAFATAVLLLFAAGCRPGAPPSPLDAAADAAFDVYRRSPDPTSFEAFLRANGAAADAHRDPFDARGIGYQLRALEIQTAEAVRTRDPHLAHAVADRVLELQGSGHIDLYDEVVPGARARLLAASELVRPLL